jgi:isoleucyl-tRNA synthetase
MQDKGQKLNFPKEEEEILEFWKKNKIFEKSVEQRRGKKKFVFYEGPPYANGRPGIHHVEARAFKDIILRYKTMRGFYAPRRAGWDTHGLPTELEVEKKLNIKTKKDIEEKIGIEKFIEEARENVFLYKEEWEKMTERMGYWLDMENAYATMTNDYIETLWWIFKEIDKRKLLYEDYKIVPWCPRCVTALSSHEVSQGYQKVKEESIYIKFPFKGRPYTYFLVWTTTPWTLPSNVALAINPKIDYVEVLYKNEKFIVASNLVDKIFPFGNGSERTYFTNKSMNLKGKDLIGLEYEPLYPDKAPYKIYAADFVSADDGTGIVHIAPAFGEDDMQLGKKEKLPVLSLVNEEGKMLKSGYKWNGMFIKDADPLIIEGLRQRNLLYKTELYEHDYPFCWRCNSPLMYYAKTSWWLKTTAVKKWMIGENKKIGWRPEYLKAGRFGEWLNELRDWAISRERYWGTPLPIWRCKKCKDYQVVGSVDELKKISVKSGNKYFTMRHGFAEHNKHNISSSNIKNDNYKILPRGKREIFKAAKRLKKEKIDLIFSSDFLRCKETAFFIAENLGIPKENVIFDERLRDVNVGIFDGKPDAEYHKYFSSTLEKFTKTPPQGENLMELKNRVSQFLHEIESKYKEKNILIVSHEYPIWMLFAGASGMTSEEAVAIKNKDDFIKTGEVMKLDFLSLPHDKNYVLDLHRPYIDKILLRCKQCGSGAERIKEVADVWFDSGAMPFASYREQFSVGRQRTVLCKLDYPADYICEAIDQTRGWFYTLLAVSSLLGRKTPYKNVLSLGLVLDAKGQKMSKSRGNAVEPMELMRKYGADAVRWYFYTINQPWDEKLFKEEDVAAALRRFILIFWNCFAYWKTYNKISNLKSQISNPKLIINKWLIARFNQITAETAKLLDGYEIVSAARLIENFVIDDISHWYIRRIRETMKNPKSKEAKETSGVFGYIILNTAKLLAPFMPFISETIYREMGEKKSIHLEDWPIIKSQIFPPRGISRREIPLRGISRRETNPKSKKLLKDMEWVREIVAKALELRAKAGIKVRQPVASLKFKIQNSKFKINEALLSLIKGEANVKDIIFSAADGPVSNWDIELDTAITAELREEGMLRELIRQFQDIRKKEGRKPNEMLIFYIAVNENGKNFLVKYAKEIKKSTKAKSLIIRSALEGGHEIKIDNLVLKAKTSKE